MCVALNLGLKIVDVHHLCHLPISAVDESLTPLL